MAAKLKSVLKGQKGAVTRVLAKFESAQTAENPNYEELQTIEETLKNKLITISGLHENIVSALPDDSEEEIEREILDQEEYVFDLQTKILKIHNYRKVTFSNLNANSQNFTDAENTPSGIQIRQNPSSSFHRLPKLDLPKFDGDILEWQSFWDSFESAIHANESLSSVQKFNYLKCSLRYEALQTIAGFSLTNANYDKAISLLQERYGQKDKIIQTYMNSLIEIPAPVHTVPSLRKFYDTTETYIRGLESLDQPESTYGSLLTPVMLQKLPPEVRQNITRTHGSQTWCLQDLMQCLQTEINVLDAGSPSPPTYDSTVSTAAFLTKSDSRDVRPPENHKPDPRRTGKDDEPAKKDKSCVYCKGSHPSVDCMKITDYSKRLEIVKQNHLCFNCLGKHKISDCKSRFKCKSCKKRHHTSLCNAKVDSPAAPSKSNSTPHNAKENHASVLHSAHSINTGPVLLKTAIATVASKSYACEANVLFDEGSQSSFITEDVAKKLQLESHGKESLSISGFGDKERRVRHLDYSFVYLKTSTETLPIKVLIVPEISVPLKTYTKQMHAIPYLKGLHLAHPVTNSDDFTIELLIGADFYWSIVQDEVIRGDGPTAIKSKIGYLLSGPLNAYTESVPTPIPVSMMNVLTMHQREEIDIERFWKVESMGVEEMSKTSDYDEYLNTYQETSIKHESGQYVAKLPWKEDHEPLPTNEQISRKRTINVIHRLQKDPALLDTYSEIINEQEKRGFIEKVPPNEIDTDNRVHYIPHHPVKKDSVTTPIRIVYDCSCKSIRDSPSLNDCLMNTPPQLNALTAILLQFRHHEHAFCTDIEKAFLNVGLHEDDRDVTRFYWLSDPRDPASTLQIYRFKSVLFGATCSPFILNAVILKHLDLNQCNVTDVIKRGLYVDNVLTSVPDEQLLLQFYTDSRQIFQQAGFNLRSWSSNNETLRQVLEQEGTQDKDSETKTLGMRWDPESDQMYYPKTKLSTNNDLLLTKREILKESSSVFDPLGLLSPVTVRSKILMQSLWQRKLAWDEILPVDITTEWCEIKTDMIKATKLKFDRCYFEKDSTNEHRLHVFVDASAKAYGACAYLVSGNHSNLVMAKNRVAPIKPLTIPKLELCAAQIGARLCQHITSVIPCDKVYLWSDSQITLQWISSTKKQCVFVANRVREIKELTGTFEWRYCPTNTNPADILSRGLTYDKFHGNRLWMKGPDWLTDETLYPQISVNFQIPMSEGDSVCENTTLLTDTDRVNPFTPGILHVLDTQRYSSYQKLVRVCAYVLRFIDICKKNAPRNEPLGPRDLDSAAKVLIKHSQQTEFQDVFQYLTKASVKPPKPCLVRQLDLHLDQDDFIRCGGRLQNAPLPEKTKFPILLPSHGKLTELIIQDAHKTQLHSATENTVTFLRQRFWIPSIRQRVRRVIRACVTCRKVSGAPYRTPDPPPLPKERLSQEPAFTVTGIDFSGALNVKGPDNSVQKVYICLFTCASTRAVHLEIVPNMTVDSFLLAARRFFSRKFTPKVIMSDNALTYIASAKVLRDELTSRGITWKFIPQHAPWYGGWWERLIGITKNCIKKVLGKALVNLETLQTLITEVECIINDRPLTYSSADPLDSEPLTPSHLMYGHRVTLPAYLDDRNESAVDTLSHESTNKLYRLKCSTIERFWCKWKHEYLTSLREFHNKHGREGDPVNSGDVVQIHEDTLPRCRWSLGVIDELVTGSDGRVRAAKVRCRRGVTTRPIAKLYPLEFSANR